MCVGACQGTTFYLSYTALPHVRGKPSVLRAALRVSSAKLYSAGKQTNLV